MNFPLCAETKMPDQTDMLRACGEFAVGCVLIAFNGA